MATAFFTDKDGGLARPLMELMEEAGQEVPSFLGGFASRGFGGGGGRRGGGKRGGGGFGGRDYRGGGGGGGGGGGWGRRRRRRVRRQRRRVRRRRRRAAAAAAGTAAAAAGTAAAAGRPGTNSKSRRETILKRPLERSSRARRGGRLATTFFINKTNSSDWRSIRRLRTPQHLFARLQSSRLGVCRRFRHRARWFRRGRAGSVLRRPTVAPRSWLGMSARHALNRDFRDMYEHALECDGWGDVRRRARDPRFRQTLGSWRRHPPRFPHRPSPLPFPARRSRTPTFARAQVDAAETAYRRLRDAVRARRRRTPAICPAGSCSRRRSSSRTLSLRVDELRTGRDLGVGSSACKELRAFFQAYLTRTNAEFPFDVDPEAVGAPPCRARRARSRRLSRLRGGRGSTSSTRERRGAEGRRVRRVAAPARASARARRPRAHPQADQNRRQGRRRGRVHRRARDGFGGEDALGLAARGDAGDARGAGPRVAARGVRRRHLRARADASARARGGYRRGGRRRLVRDRAAALQAEEEKDERQGVVLLLAVGAGPVAADHAAQSGGVREARGSEVQEDVAAEQKELYAHVDVIVHTE